MLTDDSCIGTIVSITDHEEAVMKSYHVAAYSNLLKFRNDLHNYSDSDDDSKSSNTPVITLNLHAKDSNTGATTTNSEEFYSFKAEIENLKLNLNQVESRLEQMLAKVHNNNFYLKCSGKERSELLFLYNKLRNEA